MDRWPADSTTYFTYLDFAQGVVSQSDRSTRVSYITFDSNHWLDTWYNVVVNQSKSEEFRPGMWRQRADPTQEITSLDEIFTRPMLNSCISVVVLVSNSYPIGRSLISMFDCPRDSSNIYNVTVFVREISIANNGTNKMIYEYPICVHAKEDAFESLHEFKSQVHQLTYQLRSFVAVTRVHVSGTLKDHQSRFRHSDIVTITIYETEIVYELVSTTHVWVIVGLQTHIWSPENATKIKANQNTASAVCSRFGLKPTTIQFEGYISEYYTIFQEFLVHMSNYTELQLR